MRLSLTDLNGFGMTLISFFDRMYLNGFGMTLISFFDRMYLNGFGMTLISSCHFHILRWVYFNENLYLHNFYIIASQIKYHKIALLCST